MIKNILDHIYNNIALFIMSSFISSAKRFFIDLYNKNLNNYSEIIEVEGKTLIPAIESTICYDVIKPIECKESNKTIIDVVNMDTIDCGRELQLQGYNSIDLNLASDKHPGGGWRWGCLAQEECLFYRSTYALSLDLEIRDWYKDIIDDTRQKHKLPKEKTQKWKFPVGKYTSFYSPNVFIFRDKDYNLLDWKDCYYQSFVAVAGLRNPKLVDGKYTKEDSQLLKEKIRSILRIGLMHKKDAVILGALGCGVFNCPVRETAEHFCEVFSEEEFKNKFKRIRFAILSAGKNKNYQIFKDVITKYVSTIEKEEVDHQKV